jgi:type I restriction enzyme S subunit
MDSLSSETLLSLPVIVPPCSEQRACVAYVAEQSHRIDSLMAHASVAVHLLQERRSALISAAVTGQIDVRGLAGSEAA